MVKSPSKYLSKKIGKFISIFLRNGETCPGVVVNANSEIVTVALVYDFSFFGYATISCSSIEDVINHKQERDSARFIEKVLSAEKILPKKILPAAMEESIADVLCDLKRQVVSVTLGDSKDTFYLGVLLSNDNVEMKIRKISPGGVISKSLSKIALSDILSVGYDSLYCKYYMKYAEGHDTSQGE